MLKPSENIVHRLFHRQISSRPSGCQLHKVRRLYENIVPNHTVYDVECPDYILRKFTNDGQYLIAFSRSSQHLVVYRFNWMCYCVKGDEPHEERPPPKSRKFESFFTQLYCVQLGFGSETICKDFFLTTEDGAYALFATSTRLDTESSTTEGAVPGVPALEKIKLLIVRLADGLITDDRVYNDDFIHLSHNMGVFMYEDLLAVLSVRYQCIHILQIRVTTGTFVDVRKVGDFCQDDDELLISSQAQREALFQSKQAAIRKAKESMSERPQPHVDEQQTESEARAGHFTLSGETSGNIPCPTHADARNVLVTGAASHTALRMSSANSETGTSRYVITSRQAVEVSSAATSSVLQTPVSSSGSRSLLERHSGSTGVEVTAGNVTSTAVTTSSTRSEVAAQSNFPRTVPLVSRFPPVAARTLYEAGSDPEHQLQHQQLQQQSDAPPGRVLGGIKQRLLSFIFRSTLDHDDNPVTRSQRLKRFYFHFHHYLELVMWKVQFLDRYHLLIKFGSVDGVASRSCDASQQPAFFVVYNFETTEILEFQQNSSDDFLHLFENFADHFRASQRYPLFMNYVTSYANNIFVREQMREQKAACIGNKTSSKSNSHIARRTLASVPFNSQSQSPSVYFDHSLFHFDEKLISATDRLKPSMEHPIKFLSRRRPHSLKFKINPGPENGGNEGRVQRVAAFLFHPIFPFAISVQQSFIQVVNFHFKR